MQIVLDFWGAISEGVFKGELPHLTTASNSPRKMWGYLIRFSLLNARLQVWKVKLSLWLI